MDQRTDKPVYSIGTVARLLEVSVQTLRLYESEGLILPHKSAGGQRLYTEADVHRLECIRRAITEEKVGIAGIRRMHSLIPCWQFVHCTDEERRHCPAYTDHDGGCWTYRHAGNPCEGRECRSCEVYRMATSCAGIKQLIQQTTP
ncbi:MAG TPA: MerR family transcriptional regulator [Bacteroidota bacterium]|nr:MerR family transcriptional regulator [Bacteroidota bacterium]